MKIYINYLYYYLYYDLLSVPMAFLHKKHTNIVTPERNFAVRQVGA
ncbi:hypothetical protein [Brasilonema sp. UFV-L1]|nr:hypothetical protein [Brasilonema sp. UFV-L1]